MGIFRKNIRGETKKNIWVATIYGLKTPFGDKLIPPSYSEIPYHGPYKPLQVLGLKPATTEWDPTTLPSTSLSQTWLVVDLRSSFWVNVLDGIYRENESI